MAALAFLLSSASAIVTTSGTVSILLKPSINVFTEKEKSRVKSQAWVGTHGMPTTAISMKANFSQPPS
jgi:hypothetical protein